MSEYDQTVLLLPNVGDYFISDFFNDAFLDRSLQNNTIITNENVFPSSVYYFSEGSIDFSGGYLYLQDNSELAFNATDFTIECFFYPRNNFIVIASCGVDDYTGSIGWCLYGSSYQSDIGYTIRFRTYENDQNYHGTTIVSLNAWHHLAIVRQGSTLRGYLDGQLEFEGSITVSLSSYEQFRIGRTSGSTALNTNPMYMDGLNIVKGLVKYTGTSYTIPNEPFYYPGMPAEMLVLTGDAESNFVVVANLLINEFTAASECVWTSDSVCSFIQGFLAMPRMNAFVLGVNPKEARICQVKDVNRYTLQKIMRSGGLRLAEQRVNKYYGLFTDGTQTLEVKMFYDSPNGMIEYIEKTERNQRPHYILGIDVVDYFPPDRVIGGWDLRRVLAHEMVHLLMYVNVSNYLDLPMWFIEGQAELIHGATSRVAVDLSNYTIEEIVTAIDLDSYTAPNAALVYSAGYLAVRYLHQHITNGIRSFIDRLVQGESFNSALNNTTSFDNDTEFRFAFKNNDIGNSMIYELQYTGQLNHPDTGAIGGYWVDGGPILTNETVMIDG